MKIVKEEYQMKCDMPGCANVTQMKIKKNFGSLSLCEDCLRGLKKALNERKTRKE